MHLRRQSLSNQPTVSSPLAGKRRPDGRMPRGGTTSSTATPTRATRSQTNTAHGTPVAAVGSGRGSNAQTPLGGSASRKRKSKSVDGTPLGSLSYAAESLSKRARKERGVEDGENIVPLVNVPSPVGSSGRPPRSSKHASLSKSSTPTRRGGETKLEQSRADAERAKQLDTFLSNLDAYRVKYALHLHWRSDANDDLDMIEPDVWRCKFAPSLEDGESGSHLLATCGSNSVCFVDCDKGKVMKKYVHYDEPSETFQALDWTVVQQGDVAGRSWVLAVAGKAKTIKLISLKQNVCYRYLAAHSGEVNDLKFLPDASNQLLSASADGTVLWWDIGAGFDPETPGRYPPTSLYISCQLLVHDSVLKKFSAKHAFLCLSMNPSGRFFVASDTDCAIHLFSLKNGSSKKKRRDGEEVLFDGDGWHNSFVDALHWLDDDTVLSKGCQDREMMLWNQKASTFDEPHVLQRLKWSFDKDVFGLGSHAIACRDRMCFVTGTQDGGLDVFDVDLKAKKAKPSPDSVQSPFTTLRDPRSHSCIRSVTVSHDFRFVVMADEKDITWIWTLDS